jgi:transcription termination factor Rho
MSIISPADLEASPLADLHALASALGIDGYRRLRKEDLVDAILERQGASAPPRRSRRAAAEPEAEPQDAGGSEDGDAPERPARSGRSRRAAAEPQDAGGSEDGDAPERPARSGRSRRRGGRGRGRDGEGAVEAEDRADGARESAREDAIERIAEGVVELLPNGSGFLRAQGEDDVYISAAQARRCELVAGDRVSGPVRAARRSERHPSLVRVDTINGVAAEEVVVGTRIDDVEVDFPSVAFALGDDPALTALAAAAPIGRGSRVVICGPARSGRTDLLRRIATALAAVGDGLEVELLAVGVRPEELSEWKALPYATASGLSFAASAEAQEAAVEQAAERGRRIAIRGGDAVLLIDTLDGLAPGAARRALAAARNLRGAGSLTVIATAREPLGGETTVAALSGAGAAGTLDPALTGTLRADALAAAKPARKPRAPRKPKVAPVEEADPQ